MNLTEKSNLEKDIEGTESGLFPNKILYALLLSGGLALSPALYATQAYTADFKNIQGTIKLYDTDIKISTNSEKKEAREHMVKRMRLLRELSIREGMNLLNADQISDEISILRSKIK